jgi:hypothetical protein
MSDELTPEDARRAYRKVDGDFYRVLVVQHDLILAAWERDRERLAVVTNALDHAMVAAELGVFRSDDDPRAALNTLLAQAESLATSALRERLAVVTEKASFWRDAACGWTEQGIKNAREIRRLRAGIREAADALDNLVRSDRLVAERLPASILIALESLIATPVASIEVPIDHLGQGVE